MDNKQRILTLLFNNHETWISGDELAHRLDISRTMIWKYIKMLQDEGFKIVSKRSTGYRLEPGYALNGTLLAHQLHHQIAIQAFKTIDSTNTYLKKYLGNNKLGHPLAVIAENQTNGYGRFKREFYSPANGGIYLSLAFPLNHQKLNPSLLTTSIAIGVIHTLTHFFPQQNFAVKWVNDIYLGSKKIAGILTEATADLESFTPTEVIIGVGINLTTQDFPGQLKSIAQAAGNELPVDINTIVAFLIDELLNIIENYHDGRYLPEYRSLLNLINKQVTLQVGHQTVNGTVTGISDDGGLMIQDLNRQTKIYYSGEVQKVHLGD